ncbi:hypothetical protein [Saccharopolyspora erythraea]|uniref:hypothetical protein n=1 Tax=Saccharopolyspora erythraea TaxID=1836 RepID=UPI001EFBC3F6|nr:hypothetical protein [Saccharopolyspora erythraea]
MSRPTAISPEEQEQAARRIGVLLLQAAPEDWQEITVEYRATGEYHDLLGEVTTPDGTARSWEPPEELRGIFEQLRDGMYRPDVGTWLSALYVVERPSSYRIDINFDSEPRWQRPLPRAAYADELRRYPRAEENVPDWLREKIDGRDPSEAQDTADTPTAAQEAVAQTPAPAEPGTGGTPHFRTAETFDDFDEQGRPLVATRNPVQPDEVAALRQYLENAPIVLASRENEEDLLAPDRAATVPGTWHTDGSWLWQGAVAYYLAQYGVPPEADLVEHIRARRFTLAEVDDATRDAAVSELLDQPGDDDFGESGEQGDSGADFADERAERADSFSESTGYSESPAVAQIADTPAVADPADPGAGEPVSDDQPGHRREYEDESFDDRSFTDELDDRSFGRESFDEDVARDERADTADSWSPEPETRSAADDDSQPDAQEVFAKLHDKLTEYAVDGSAYRIGSHSSDARSLVQEGPDWIVTAGADDEFGSDVRFSRPDQAAAYLLGSLLLSRPGGQAPSRHVRSPSPSRKPRRTLTSRRRPTPRWTHGSRMTRPHRARTRPRGSRSSTARRRSPSSRSSTATRRSPSRRSPRSTRSRPRFRPPPSSPRSRSARNPNRAARSRARAATSCSPPTRIRSRRSLPRRRPRPVLRSRSRPGSSPPRGWTARSRRPVRPPRRPPRRSTRRRRPAACPRRAARGPAVRPDRGRARRRCRSARARSRARRCRRPRAGLRSRARPVARSDAPAPVGRAWRGHPGRGRRSRPARPEAVRRRAAGRSRGVRRRARASRSSRSVVSRR